MRLQAMMVVVSLASLAAVSGAHALESKVAPSVRSAQRPVAIPENVQVRIRNRCALLQGPEYHECMYEVLMQGSRGTSTRSRRPS